MTVSDISKLISGAEINNKQLCSIFECGPQGGMRRSLKTKTLVIVSNHVDSIYDDRWQEDVFYYTGMGRKGNQSLSFFQNKTLAESPTNDVKVHLFEVFERKKYTYIGQMVLADEPFFESQPDEAGKIRSVCVFPLKMANGEAPKINKSLTDKLAEHKESQARRLSDDELAERAKNGKKTPGVRSIVGQQFERSPWVAAAAKRRARGICQLCKQPAPFKNNKGEPYLETHHIVWLAKGGEDTISNTVALCPNCHRKVHVLNRPADIRLLKKVNQS